MYQCHGKLAILWTDTLEEWCNSPRKVERCSVRSCGVDEARHWTSKYSNPTVLESRPLVKMFIQPLHKHLLHDSQLPGKLHPRNDGALRARSTFDLTWGGGWGGVGWGSPLTMQSRDASRLLNIVKIVTNAYCFNSSRSNCMYFKDLHNKLLQMKRKKQKQTLPTTEHIRDDSTHPHTQKNNCKLI